MLRQILLAFILLCGSAFATTTFISQSGGSVSCGADGTQTTQAYTWFNTASNYVAGDTIKVCGAITGTGTAATNVLTTQATGSSGNPITLFFETGSSIKLPSCGTKSTNPTGGCVTVSNQWWVIDGNNLAGTIQNTLNGTSGATCPGGTCSLNNATAGVYVGASNVVVKNLTIADMYDRTPCNNSTNEASSYGVFVDGTGAITNVTVSGNTIHDGLNLIAFSGGSTSISNMTATGNTLSRSSAGVVLAEGGGASTATNTTVSFNDISDAYYWWDTADSDHLNGMHLFAAASGTHMTGVVINGNYIHGDFGGNTCGGGGSHTTASIYIETTGGGAASGVQVFNNKIVTGLNDDPSGGMIAIGDGSDVSPQIYNNTMIGNATSGPLNGIGMLLTAATLKAQNNIGKNLNYGIFLNGTGVSQITLSDTNDWFTVTNFRVNGSVESFATWKANGIKFDPNSITTDPNLNASTFVPNGGSPVIGTGLNLTSLGIIALDTDYAGAARPPVAAWDMGALQASGTSSFALTVTVNGLGTVTDNTAAISCPGTCSANYTSGTVVTLTATPTVGNTFSGWSGSGGCTGTGTCVLTMSAAKAATAQFNTAPAPASALFSFLGGDRNYHIQEGNPPQQLPLTVQLYCQKGKGTVNTGFTAKCTIQ